MVNWTEPTSEQREKWLRQDCWGYNYHKEKEYQQGKRKNIREKIGDILGYDCCICGKSPKHRNHPCHEIHGNKHSQDPKTILKNIENFVRLCQSCHNGVHWLMRIKNMTWNEIKEFLM